MLIAVKGGRGNLAAVRLALMRRAFPLPLLQGGSGMKAFAKAILRIAAWRRTRAYILKRDAGLCVRCGAPGCIVHHKTELTPRNIDDPMITLNEDNLETVCRTCHAIIHEGTPPLADGLAFDADGNVIESAISPPCAAENFRRRNRASATFRTAPVAHMRGG